MSVNNMIQCRVEVLEAVGSSNENNGRDGGHPVNSFHVKRLLAIPSLRILCEPLLGMVVSSGCDNLNELACCKCRKPAIGRPLISILDDRRCCVGVDNRYRLT